MIRLYNTKDLVRRIIKISKRHSDKYSLSDELVIKLDLIIHAIKVYYFGI